jgi:hypothetical protein
MRDDHFEKTPVFKAFTQPELTLLTETWILSRHRMSARMA